MIHHVATQEVVDAIEEVARKSANVLPQPNTLVRATELRVESSARSKKDEILMDEGKGPVRLSTRRAS